MEFPFRAGDRGPPGYTPSVPGGSPPAWFAHPQAGPLPPPPPRELIIREEVTRRLTEQWAKGDPAFARAVNEGFFAPDRFMPPPPPHAPMPMHPLPHGPPPVPLEEFGAWQGFGPRLHVHAGFGERTRFLFGARWGSTPRPDPKHKLKLPEVEPSRRPEALPPKVPMMQRKADANAATTVPKKAQKLAEDWSCAPYQVSAPSEAGLNEHLGGGKHKAKLAQCGVSKVIKDDKNCLQTTTGNENNTNPCDAPKKICMLVDSATSEAGLNEHLGGEHKAKLAQCGVSKAIKDDKNCMQTITGNENNTDPCDAPKKICMLVDGEVHEVVRKNNYLWCDLCRVRCDSNAIMAGHLRSKKHSKLNKVSTSVKAVRTNTDTKEGLTSCGSLVNTNSSTEIPAVIEGKINMTTKVDESGPVENPVQKEIHPWCKKHSKLNDGWTSIKALRTNTNTKKEIHKRSKKQSKLNNVSTSIKAVRSNTDTKEGLPSCGSQALSSNPKVPTVKRKADANAATTVPKKVQKLSKDWSCALCQVSVSFEAALNEHLRGRKHKAKLAHCGVSKTINDGKNCLQTTTGNENSTGPCDGPKKICMLGGRKHKAKLAQFGVSKTIKDGKNCSQTTTGNENSTDPCDAPKKISMLVDSAMHEVVRKDNYLWCDHCRVSCDNYATMACHLRCKKQSKLTKVCSSIKAVRTNTNTKEGLPSSFGSQVNTNGSTEIPAVIEGDINMTTVVDESVPVENPVRKEMTRMATIKAVRTNTDTKEGLPSSCGSRVNTNGSIEIRAVIEGDINMTTAVCESGPVENPVRKVFTRMATIKAARTNTGTKESLPSCGSQALSSNPKVPTVKRRADANAATTVPKKVQKPTKDSSCSLCQVSRPCEAALNAHLGGTKHMAKLAQYGVSKTVKDGKNCSQMTTGNENSTDPCDAPKKICMLVDGTMHEVVRKDNYLWCDHCRVSCDNYATMACHLGCKKQSKLTKVCSSIKAVTTNTNTKEGLPSSFGSQVNTKGSTEIPAVIEGDINMTTEVDKSGPVENPVQKEIQRMATIWAMFSC